MSKYAIRRGHQRTGQDGCAEDILNEIDVVNAYYQVIIDGLIAQGHEVLDVTPPEANRTLGDSLIYGVRMANNWGADYFISCHANSCDTTQYPVGCEVIYLDGSVKGQELACSVDAAIANLGFKDRGAKADVRGLCELHRTYAPAIIIEPFFISSQADVELFNTLGATAIGNAIVKGLTGKGVTSIKPGWNHNSKGWWYCTNVTEEFYYKSVWKLIDGQWFSFNEEGYAKCNKWELYKDKWYYLTSDCSMAKSQWLWIDGECYCFDKDGAMYENCTTPDGYKVDETGAWIH